MSTPQYPPPPGPPPGPPYPPPGWQQPGWAGPPPQPRKSNAGKIIGFSCLGVVALAVLVAVSGVVGLLMTKGDSGDPKPGASKESRRAPAAPSESKDAGGDEAESEATGEVKIDACTIDDLIKWPSAELTITNRGSKTSDYVVQVEFVDSGGKRIGEGLAATKNLGPGQQAKETAQGLEKATGKITCRVTEVTRYVS